MNERQHKTYGSFFQCYHMAHKACVQQSSPKQRDESKVNLRDTKTLNQLPRSQSTAHRVAFRQSS